MVCIYALYTIYRGSHKLFLVKGVMSRGSLRKLLCVSPLFQNIELLLIHPIDWIMLGELSAEQQWLKTELCLSGEALRVENPQSHSKGSLYKEHGGLMVWWPGLRSYTWIWILSLDHVKLSEAFMLKRDGKATSKGGVFLLLLSSRSNEPL